PRSHERERARQEVCPRESLWTTAETCFSLGFPFLQMPVSAKQKGLDFSEDWSINVRNSERCF
ncbi:MAG: hypothetical protein WCL44_10680, partial [bacterium]